MRMKAETATVTRADCGENADKGSAMTAPVEDATTKAMTGRSHVAVITSNECFCRVIL